MFLGPSLIAVMGNFLTNLTCKNICRLSLTVHTKLCSQKIGLFKEILATQSLNLVECCTVLKSTSSISVFGVFYKTEPI